MTNGLFGGCFGHFNMSHHLKGLVVRTATVFHFGLIINHFIPALEQHNV